MDASRIPSSLTVLSAKDGTYLILGVPPGDWQVCAEPHNHAALLLNNCRWGSGEHVNVSGGVAVAPAIRLQRGTPLHVRLADDLGDIRDGQHKRAMPLVGIAGPAGMIVIPQVGSDEGGLDFQMLVPFDREHRVTVLSKDYFVTNEVGKSVEQAPIRAIIASVANTQVAQSDPTNSAALVTFHLRGYK